MRKQLAIAAILLTVSHGARAADTGAFVDVFFIPSAELEVTVPGSGNARDDGDGFGFRGMVPAGGIAVTGEYQTTRYDDSGIEFDQLRLGIGLVNETTSGLLLEYVDTELDGAAADGFAVHGRFAAENFYGQLGYVRLEDDF